MQRVQRGHAGRAEGDPSIPSRADTGGAGPGAPPRPTHHGVAQEEDGQPRVVLLHGVHVLEHIPDEDVEVGHHHPLALALPVANWKGNRHRTGQQRLAPPPSPAVSSRNDHHSPGRTPPTLPSTLSSVEILHQPQTHLTDYEMEAQRG